MHLTTGTPPYPPPRDPVTRPRFGRRALDDPERSQVLMPLGLGFILLTLAALVIVPGLVQRRVMELRDEIEAAEPARTLVMQLQFNLVREMASLGELLLDGDTTYRERYREARAAEDRLFRELRPLAGVLGEPVESRLDDAERRAAEWHDRVADSVITRPGVPPRARADFLREPELFEEALGATAAVDSAILRATTRSRSEIRRVEMTGMGVTVALGFLAFLAALAAANLHLRVRRFGREADRQRREAERALDEAARLTEARTRLLRGVTHDVKNPLGAAKGYTELLAMGVKGPLDPAQGEYLVKIQHALDSALAIIADLLDVARADSGGLPMHPKATDLDVVIAECVESHRAAAEVVGHTIAMEPGCDGVVVQTDPRRVQQVLGNLLSNAIKYTPPPGRITVRTAVVEGRRGPGDGPWLTVEVLDTGPGIPEPLREAIFDEFTRLHDGVRIKGHGLGLAIARRVARLLGGELSVGDAPEGGALFTLWVPVDGAAAGTASAVGRRPSAGTTPGEGGPGPGAGPESAGN